MKCLVALLSCVLLSCLAGAQQSTPVPTLESRPPNFSVTTRLVVLDVVVTDRHGQLRNDLKREDFQVIEDGVPQTIVDFELPSSHPVPSGGPPIESTADLEARAPQAPVDVIVLDEMNTTFQDMAFARYALKKYLNAQQGTPAPTMLIAVSFDRFTVLHDYTQNREEILKALDHHLTHYPWNLERGESKYINFAKSLGALEQVAEGTRGHPGHKNIIWVGKGFPGIDLSSPNLTQGAVAGIQYATQQAVDMLRDSRVTLYTIDPTILSSTIAVTSDADSIMTGLDGSMDATAPDPFVGDVNFTGLAKVTGGKSFYSRNDVDREIDESVRDGVNYYTISYHPTNASDEEKPYRKIRVNINIAGLRAFYRDGYYANASDHVSPKDPRTVYDLQAAEESTMVYTGLTVHAIGKPGGAGTYLVGVPQSELTWSEDGSTESAKLRVVAAAVNNKGEVLARATEFVTAHRSGNAAAPASQNLAKVEIQLQTPPNTHRVRFVVRNEVDGRLGTADILIPGAAPPKNTR